VEAREAEIKISPLLKAVTLRITDSSETKFGTGLLFRFSLPAEKELSSSCVSNLGLVTASELLPSVVEALDARVEIAEPGSANFCRHELVHSSSCFWYLPFKCMQLFNSARA
jgi:hypothetical protein